MLQPAQDASQTEGQRSQDPLQHLLGSITSSGSSSSSRVKQAVFFKVYVTNEQIERGTWAAVHPAEAYIYSNNLPVNR
jgi:hypothetical protein